MGASARRRPEMLDMRLIGWILGTLLPAGTAVAQEIQLAQDKVLSDKEKSSAMQWLMMTVFLIACLVVAFKPAKRSKLE
jgi:hypothetical protein